MPIGFGIVGTGMISRFHAKASRNARRQAGGLLRHAPRQGRGLGQGIRPARAYDSLDAMLADKAVDAVTIATPSGAHMEPAVAAARAGKHVIVEKPLEITLERCDKIIDACDKAGVKLSTIFPSRFHDVARS